MSMIEEVINVNPRNTSSLPPKGVDRNPFEAARFPTLGENPLYPRSPLIAGERRKNIAATLHPSRPLVGLSLRDINIIARVNVYTCSRPCTRQLRVYHARHEHPGGKRGRMGGWVSAGRGGGGVGCIGENSSRSKYCNIWRDSYEFRVTPPAPSTFHTFHFLDTSLKYCRGSTGLLPLLGVHGRWVRGKGKGRGCLCLFR